MNLNQAKFLISASQLKQLPTDAGIEVAFVGRSNSGKSTALNVLTGIKKLAYTSKTPGRTQLINLFELDEVRRLVDLPGYGYAKVPEAIKKRWQQTLSDYLSQRQCLSGLVLLMDIRHPLKEIDVQLLELAINRELKVHILLTKSDKVSRGEAGRVLQQVKSSLQDYKDVISVQIFSSLKKVGFEQAKETITGWLGS